MTANGSGGAAGTYGFSPVEAGSPTTVLRGTGADALVSYPLDSEAEAV